MPPWYLGRPPPPPTSRRGKEREIITNGSQAPVHSSLPNFRRTLLTQHFVFTWRVYNRRPQSFCCQDKRPKPHSRRQEDKRARLVFLFFFFNNRHFAIVRDLERIKNNAGRLLSNAAKNKTPRVCLCSPCGRNCKKYKK